MKSELTGIRDLKGQQYRVNDILYNPAFGDYWLVEKYNKQDIDNGYVEECKYCLTQYGNKSLYFMDLDEPYGFEIVRRKGQRGYYILLNKMKKLARYMLIEERKWNNE